jgi:hypothetical protein
MTRGLKGFGQSILWIGRFRGRWFFAHSSPPSDCEIPAWKVLENLPAQYRKHRYDNFSYKMRFVYWMSQKTEMLRFIRSGDCSYGPKAL